MKEDYKNYIYFKIPKEEFERLKKEALENEKGRYKKLISFDELMDYYYLYKGKIEGKEKGAKLAHRIKKAKTNMNIYKALENYYTGLFRENTRLTPYRLSKLSKTHYQTAKRFWNEYNLDYWIKEFEKDNSSLSKFKFQELSESLVYGR